MDDGLVIAVSRAVVKHGRRGELDPLLRSVLEIDEHDPGTIVHAMHAERDNPNVIWNYTVYRDWEARAIHGEHVEPIRAQMADLWEQWAYPHWCDPIAAKGIQF